MILHFLFPQRVLRNPQEIRHGRMSLREGAYHSCLIGVLEVMVP